MVSHTDSSAGLPAAGRQPTITPLLNAALWGFGFLVSVIQIAARVVSPPSADISWLLYATRRLLHGARLGTDILEVSPPMIFALKAPIVALAGWIGSDPAPLWFIAVGFLGWLMMVLTLVNIRQVSWMPQGPAGAIVAILAWLLFVLPGADLGQKDHLAILLMLPSAGLAMARVSGTKVSRWAALLTGASAALGLGLKPHFALVALAVLACERDTLKRARLVLFPEHLVTGVMLVAYLLATVLASPGYLAFVAGYGPLYGQYLPVWLFPTLGLIAVPAPAVVTAYAFSRSRMAPQARGGCDVLAAMTFSCYLAALLQAKGWAYHFIPAHTLAGALLSAMILLGWRSKARAHLGQVALGVAAYALVFVPSIENIRSGLRIAWASLSSTETRVGPNVWSGVIVPGEQVAVLSTAIESSFPMVPAEGGEWAFRFPHMWPLAVFNKDRIMDPRPINQPAHIPIGEREKAFLRIVCQDLVRAAPRKILVVRQSPWSPELGVAQRFDYVSYLSVYPPLGAVLRQYERRGRVGNLDLMILSGPSFRGADCDAR